MIARRADRLKSELSLNDAQYNSIKQIDSEYAAKWKKLYDQRKADIANVLTPAQQEQLKSLQAKNREKHQERRRGNHVAQLKTALSLTDDQASKISALDKQMADKFRAQRKDSSASKEEVTAQRQAMRTEYEAEMKKILTADQFTKWKQIQADRANERKASGGMRGGRRFRR
jgi:Spy/CpxP family protein refolding chaperone